MVATMLASLAAVLSGCMALAVAPLLPIANSFTDRPVSWNYTTTARHSEVFNAALKTLTARGTQELAADRETGSIRGTVVVSGMTAYIVTVLVENKGAKTTLQMTTKLETISKFDLKNSSDIANELVQDIERQIGAKLERT